MAAPPSNTPQVEEVFKNSTWQAQAERPDTLDRLGPTWSAFLAGKGQGLKAYMEDLQLAYTMLRDPHFQMAKETKTVLIIALLYIISPIDFPIGGFSPPEGRLARGFKPPAFTERPVLCCYWFARRMGLLRILLLA